MQTSAAVQKNHGNYVVKLSTHVPFDPAILLPGISISKKFSHQPIKRQV